MDHRAIEENQVPDRYLLGSLPAAERAEFEEHYLDCPACLEHLEAAEGLRAGLGAFFGRGRSDPSRPARGVFLRPAVLLAAACLALGPRPTLPGRYAGRPESWRPRARPPGRRGRRPRPSPKLSSARAGRRRMPRRPQCPCSRWTARAARVRTHRSTGFTCATHPRGRFCSSTGPTRRAVRASARSSRRRTAARSETGTRRARPPATDSPSRFPPGSSPKARTS